jgi:hypothetical protein
MTLSPRQYALSNGFIFQAAWPVCVLGGDAVALLTTMLVLVFHLWAGSQHRTECIFLLTAGITGIMFDAALLYTGVLVYDSFMQPIWMCCLWFLFATTLGASLRWFQKHLFLGAIFAGCFAPLSYKLGAALTSVNLLHPEWQAMLIIGCAWAFVFPGLLALRHMIYRQFGSRQSYSEAL